MIRSFSALLCNGSQNFATLCERAVSLSDEQLLREIAKCREKLDLADPEYKLDLVKHRAQMVLSANSRELLSRESQADLRHRSLAAAKIPYYPDSVSITLPRFTWATIAHAIAKDEPANVIILRHLPRVVGSWLDESGLVEDPTALHSENMTRGDMEKMMPFLMAGHVDFEVA